MAFINAYTESRFWKLNYLALHVVQRVFSGSFIFHGIVTIFMRKCLQPLINYFFYVKILLLTEQYYQLV